MKVPEAMSAAPMLFAISEATGHDIIPFPWETLLMRRATEVKQDACKEIIDVYC